MKNKIADLNDHLFAQLERLAEEDISAMNLEREVTRTEAMIRVSDQILKSANTVLHALRIKAEHGNRISVPFLEQASIAPTPFKAIGSEGGDK